MVQPFFPSVCFLLSPQTDPSFVVVVELQQLIGVTSPRTAYRRGRPWSGSANHTGRYELSLTHVTPRPLPEKDMTGQSAEGLGGITPLNLRFPPETGTLRSHVT